MARESSNRMILDLDEEVRLAIRLYALKAGKTNAQAVADAVEMAFADDLEQARQALAKPRSETKTARRHKREAVGSNT